MDFAENFVIAKIILSKMIKIIIIIVSAETECVTKRREVKLNHIKKEIELYFLFANLNLLYYFLRFFLHLVSNIFSLLLLKDC